MIPSSLISLILVLLVIPLVGVALDVLALPYDDEAQHSRAAVYQLLLPVRRTPASGFCCFSRRPCGAGLACLRSACSTCCWFHPFRRSHLLSSCMAIVAIQLFTAGLFVVPLATRLLWLRSSPHGSRIATSVGASHACHLTNR